ncbi:hypothetical protein KKF64_00170 [Patescibacteria group bacterium]|nr:hypothetical protein [Patescibacteria group bacterium]
MKQIINKVFDLIDKTGDRCIILSEDSDNAYAIMSLQEYERLALGNSDLIDLTEDQFLDKINRDIAVWKSQQNKEDDDNLITDELDKNDEYNDEDIGMDFDNNLANTSQNYNWKKEEIEEEDPYYFEKV